ncbi:MAG: LiaF-related protein [Lachnospiraceae bacterium]|nr:LiaF-related protein [Lachnospiraceae bacterium]
MKKERIYWGLFWIVCAVFIIVCKLGYFSNIGVLSLLLTVFFAAWIIKGLVRLNFATIIFPLAFIGIIYSEQLGIQAITPWPLLAAALFGTIGVSMIYHPKRGYRKNDFESFDETYDGHYNADVSNEEGSDLNFSVHFGGSVKYIKSDNFRSANIENVFGGLKVYLDDAVIQNGEAHININGSFSGTELYVPKSWNVINRIDATLGGVDEKNRPNTTGTPTLILSGNINLGGVTIIYI